MLEETEMAMDRENPLKGTLTLVREKKKEKKRKTGGIR